MSLLNEDSSSLVIAQGKNQLDINCSQQQIRKQEDLFELSRDDPTLSFHIQQQKKQPIYIEISQTFQEVPLKNNQNQIQNNEQKKKRKDIFQKFKRPQTQIARKFDSSNTEDNLLNIFDSIFKTKNAQVQSQSSRQTQPNPNLLRPATEIIDRSKTPSAQKRQRLKIFDKKKGQRQYQGILPSQLIQSQVSPYQATQNKPRLIGSPILEKKSSDSINFSVIENRLSGIHVDQNNEFSRQQLQIKNILESEIFREQQVSPKKMTINTQKIKQELPKIMFKIEREQAVIQSIDISPQKKQTRIPIIPKIQQKNEAICIPIEQSKVLRSQTSILSLSPTISLQGYQEISNGGFKPQNSMANLPVPNIADLNEVNVINSINSGANLYESHILQSIPSIVKINHFDSQKRMPVFLREIRKHISIYPNFYAFNNLNTPQCIRIEFQQLFQLFTIGLNLLNRLSEQLLNLKQKKLLYQNQLYNSKTIIFFLNLGWQKIANFQQFNVIKPMQPFQPRQWNYQKAKAALNNYEGIIQHYKNKKLSIDVTSDKGRRRYFELRQKCWDICGNMKLISEDIYTEMIDCKFPEHYQIFSQYLTKQFPSELKDEILIYTKSIHNLYMYLKGEKDMLVNSIVGKKIRQKLELQMKFLNPY